MAGRYYGLDRQYFTTMIDYGFSKLLEETLGKWGRDNVLRDVVRIIRMDRPLVIISRFQGNPRDGHGNHEAAGLITQLAYRAAGDPSGAERSLAHIPADALREADRLDIAVPAGRGRLRLQRFAQRRRLRDDSRRRARLPAQSAD